MEHISLITHTAACYLNSAVSLLLTAKHWDDDYFMLFKAVVFILLQFDFTRLLSIQITFCIRG